MTISAISPGTPIPSAEETAEEFVEEFFDSLQNFPSAVARKKLQVRRVSPAEYDGLRQTLWIWQNNANAFKHTTQDPTAAQQLTTLELTLRTTP